DDVLAIHAAAGEALQRARSGGGPTLLECKTYRTRPHAEGMGDFGYRTREDVEEWKTRCPIERYRRYLLAESVAPDADLARIETEIKAVADDGERFAEGSPWPDPASA